MGAGCGGSCSATFDGVSAGFKRALWIVIAINAIMFLVEMLAGFAGRSMALKADALDFLGDTVTYAISLWVIGRANMLRARVALFKGYSLAAMGFFVLAATLYRFFVLGHPDEMVMGSIGALALAANLLSVLILLKYRDGDANVRSVWLCSRNDAIGDVAVLVAAVAVYYTKTPWPDLIVAGLMASLFLSSASQIIAKAKAEIAQEQAQDSCCTQEHKHGHEHKSETDKSCCGSHK
jgi:Co/Zn/Cd efflux system component